MSIIFEQPQSIISSWIVDAADEARAVLGFKTMFLIGITVLALGWAVFWKLRSLYRLHFHPLCKFPGPKEAFEELHEKYNTKALRIGPNELHITYVKLYKTIYSQSNPFPKYPAFYDGFNTPHTVFAETDTGMHKERRRMLNPLFSRIGVFKLEPIIHEKIELLLGKIRTLCKKGPINTYDAFRLLTTEIILEFAFGRSAGMIEEDPVGFHSWFLSGFDVASDSIADMQYNPWLRRASNLIPLSLVEKMKPELVELIKITKFAESSVRHWQYSTSPRTHPIVFDNLSALPDQYKATEAMDILIAGADTTASTLTTGLFHIIRDDDIMRRLVQELDSVIPTEDGRLSLQSLEKLEFLSACVKESLRVGMAVPGRLPRVVPQPPADPFSVDGKTVPPGTVVSISAYTMHTDVSVWGPDAREFRPSRWIGPESKGLEQYFATFSKGARMCIGQNLAQAEVTLALAYLLREFKLTLSTKYGLPKRRDRFTLQYLHPGLQVNFELRK